MPKSKTLSVLSLAVAVLALTGCERKIVNEAPPPQDGLAADACFTCHGDDNFELIAAQQQWVNSQHASGENTITRSSCAKCHTDEGFVAEVLGVTADGEHFTTINCFTCHAPHTNGNMNVRAADPVTLGNGEIYDKGPANLCANCHR